MSDILILEKIRLGDKKNITIQTVGHLLEKGIISKVEKNGVAHFSPANPARILDFLEQKKKEIDEEKQVVNNILPSLLLKFKETREKVNVEVFQGWNGLKTVFEDVLEECQPGDKNYVFGASRGEPDEQADRFFVKYSTLRAEKSIMTWIIFNEELRRRKKRIEFFLKSKWYKVRFLQQTTPAEIMLYKDKACIIILTQEPLVIRITGKEVMGSFKQYFEVSVVPEKAVLNFRTMKKAELFLDGRPIFRTPDAPVGWKETFHVDLSPLLKSKAKPQGQQRVDVGAVLVQAGGAADRSR